MAEGAYEQAQTLVVSSQPGLPWCYLCTTHYYLAVFREEAGDGDKRAGTVLVSCLVKNLLSDKPMAGPESPIAKWEGLRLAERLISAASGQCRFASAKYSGICSR